MGDGDVHDAALTDVSRYYDALHFWTRFSGFRAVSGSHE
jgi:hypothetical protein